MSNKSEDILSLIRKDVAKKNENGDDIQSFIKILTIEEKEKFETLTLESDKEKFINKIMLSRAGALHGKISNISIDQKIAKDISEVTTDNLRELLRTKKTDELEKELGTGMNLIKREYMSKYSKLYVEKRNKKRKDGSLDIYLNIDEHAEIDKLVEKKLFDNPAYKFSLIVINNASGTIDVFNDKMVESKRDYEINKLIFCNEKGMTPESYDSWQEYVKITVQAECLDSESGFANLMKFDEQWHKDTFRKFYKKFPGFVKGETLVYKSEILEELDKYDSETLGKSRNSVTGTILNEFDRGMVMLNTKTEEDQKVINITGPEVRLNKDANVLSGLELRKKKLAESKLNKVDEVKDIDLEKEDKSDVSKFFNSKLTNTPVIETPINEPIIKEVNKEVTFELTNDEPVFEFIGDIDGDDEELPIDPTIIHEVVTDPDFKLSPYRNKEVETDVLVKYVRKPDTNILKTINDPKLRIEAYRNSAVVSGFKFYLPYSGYEIVVKKLVDKTKLSYIFSMLDRVWSKQDLERFIEQETLKIVFSAIEFPDIQEVVTFKDFISNLSLGDVPILMIAFAMTNIPEDDHGRIKLGFKSIKCTDPTCDEILPLSEISVDLKDLFSKVYPYNKYKDIIGKSIEFNDITSAYRSTSSGEVHMVSTVDSDEICKYTVYYSQPTVYKENMVDNKSSEVNYEVVKEDLFERHHVYKEMYGIQGLDEYLKDMSYEAYNERTATLASNLSVMSNQASDFTETEMEAISNFIRDNVTEIHTISKILETNYLQHSKVFGICKYIDMIVIETMDGEPIVKITDCQENLYETIQTISQMPNKLVEELTKQTNKLGSTYKFEHDNVFYTSEDVKHRIDKEFLKKWSKEDNKNYVDYLKSNNVNITQSQIDLAIEEKGRSFKNLVEGKCICGNDTFFINYMSIVFFSISNR